MAKLISLVAAALLTVTLASLNANAALGVENRGALNPGQPVAEMCWIWVGGRWWEVPC
jgi:hypothetical protein